MADEQFCAGVLLSDEWRDIGLETTGTDTHDNNGDDEASKRTVAVLDDTGNRGDDEETVTN